MSFSKRQKGALVPLLYEKQEHVVRKLYAFAHGIREFSIVYAIVFFRAFVISKFVRAQSRGIVKNCQILLKKDTLPECEVCLFSNMSWFMRTDLKILSIYCDRAQLKPFPRQRQQKMLPRGDSHSSVRTNQTEWVFLLCYDFEIFLYEVLCTATIRAQNPSYTK